MADVVSKAKRSLIMKAVKSSGNASTELQFIKILKRLKVKGWKRKYRLLGNPDFVFPKKRIVVFIDGCFWHGHGCRSVRPRNNAKYWKYKIWRNKKRDKYVSGYLNKKDWKVIRLWECAVKNVGLPKKIKSIMN